MEGVDHNFNHAIAVLRHLAGFMNIMNFLHEIGHSIRVADALDIVVVSILLYTFLTWFRETTSRSVIVGVSVLAIIYFTAREFDMYMTVFLFQAVFAVSLIALIVVFQEDLRRAFERLATLDAVRNRSRMPIEHTEIDVIVESVYDLAIKKVGALIVLKREEPLERHIDGGIPMDAQISKPLLDSIFDPHSMGHDGAVVIERGRITLFSAHLPLSKSIKEARGRGTRHCAALGISECSDALCVVLSEERGEICVAENGKLNTINAPTDLKNRLVRFYDRHLSKDRPSFWKRVVREHAILKLLSVLIACIAWVLIAYDVEIVQQTFTVPIEYRNRPKDLVLDDASPSEAKVTLSGYKRTFKLFEPTQMRFSIDLAGLNPGSHRMELDASRLQETDELEINRVTPRIATISLHRSKTVELHVEPTTIGYVASPAELVSVVAEPASIQVTIVKSTGHAPQMVYTVPIDLGQIKKTTTVKARLVLPEDVLLPNGKSATVDVHVKIRPPDPVDRASNVPLRNNGE